jgi:tRNA threonylcarbamoyladenosine biosynthesis protein TsaB
MPILNLAIETSGRNHSVAISNAGKIVARQNAESFWKSKPIAQEQPGPGSASLLMPVIRAVFDDACVEPDQVGLISVTNGPGSFTGLRVGVVTAKTLSYALDCPLVAVDTLRACAVRSLREHGLKTGQTIKTVINAQRGQLFAAGFQVVSGTSGSMDCVAVAAAKIVEPEQCIGELNENDFVTGPGLKMVASLLEATAKEMPSIKIEQASYRGCDVATVAAIGEQKFHAGEIVSAWDLQPVYFRPSAAEEVRAAKRK